MNPKTVAEDKDFLIIDKPPGWITNEATTTKSQPVIQTYLKENFDYPIAKDWEFRSGIVHRLDKETSGVLLVAKTRDAFIRLQSEFKERRVEKTYIALVHGKLEEKVGEIDAPVGRLPWRRDRFGVLAGGREARTDYKVLRVFKDKEQEYSLLELKPKTGRTHQIRIHLKHLGHPVVGDEFYAGRKTARRDRLWSPRLFLHAAGISFIHPASGETVNYQTELPPDLTGALATLEEMSENI